VRCECVERTGGIGFAVVRALFVSQVIPSLIHVPSCYVKGDGYSLGRFETVPEPVLREDPAISPVLDYPVWLAPDRPELTVVGCDEWGNQVQSGGAAVVARLFRYLDRPPSRASSVSSGEKSADFDDVLTTDEVLSQLDSIKSAEDSKLTEETHGLEESKLACEDSADVETRNDGGAASLVSVAAGPGWYEVGRMANIKVTDNNDGTYTIAYTIRHAGRHQLEVRFVLRFYCVACCCS
jgi:hypothetical protein